MQSKTKKKKRKKKKYNKNDSRDLIMIQILYIPIKVLMTYFIDLDSLLVLKYEYFNGVTIVDLLPFCVIEHVIDRRQNRMACIS